MDFVLKPGELLSGLTGSVPTSLDTGASLRFDVSIPVPKPPTHRHVSQGLSENHKAMVRNIRLLSPRLPEREVARQFLRGVLADVSTVEESIPTWLPLVSQVRLPEDP